MSWGEHRRTHYALLGAVILIFFGSLAAAVYDQVQRNQIFEDSFRNTSWLVAQSEREFLLFENTLTNYVYGVESTSHEDLILQFEIFWSRIPLILEGDEGESARELPGAVEDLEAILQALERIEPLVYGLERGDLATYERIAGTLDTFRQPLHRLVQDTLVHTRIQTEAFSRYTPVYKVSLFLIGILATGTILVLLLLRDRARIARLLETTQDAERRAEAAHQRLSEAIEISPDGITLFDSAQRLIFANTPYREIYGLSADQAAPGTHFKDILAAVLARGDIVVPDAGERAWIDARLRKHEDPPGPWEQQLADGRWIRINEKRTQEGGIIGVCADITDMKRREERLAGLVQQNQQFATAIAAAPTGVLIARFSGDRGGWEISYVNETYARMVGESADAIMGQAWEHHDPEARDYPCSSTRTSSVRRSGPVLVQRRFERPGGEELHVEIRLSPVHDEAGDLTAMVGLYDDVTERVRHLDALSQSEARLKSLASHVPGVLYQRRSSTDGSQEYTYISEQLERLFPVTLEDVYRNPGALAELVHEEDRPAWAHAQSGHGGDGRDSSMVECRFRSKDGSPLWIRTVERADYQADGTVLWSGLLLNVTDQKNIEARLEFLAYHDSLTGLPNRALFEDRLKLAMRSAERRKQQMVLHYIDIDNFKDINDTLGHGAGDRLLVFISEQLRKSVRETDTVARISGDEFAIIQVDLNEPGDAVVLAERLINAVAQPVDLGDRTVTAGCSIGLVTYNGEDLTHEDLPMRADIALYRAKAAGRGSYKFYDSALDRQMRTHVDIRESLRRALEHDELFLEYQPQIEIETGEVMGVEALIRWRPNGGQLRSPAEFIPVAEESGIIVDIGAWVLHTACTQNKAWQDAGYPAIPVSVNLSPEEFSRSNVFDTVSRTLADTGLDPALLEIEIMENVFLQDSVRVSTVLEKLRAIGVRIAIDDFGTGYSSLGYLKSFAVDKIKIDRGFLRDGVKNEADTAIVESIIYIAAKLGLKITGEGIESLEHARWLHEHGCRLGQGYYFCRSCDASLFAEFWNRALDRPDRDAADSR